MVDVDAFEESQPSPQRTQKVKTYITFPLCPLWSNNTCYDAIKISVRHFFKQDVAKKNKHPDGNAAVRHIKGGPMVI
jgi:hypothetical protein